MIKKLKIKFIVLSMTSLFILLTLILTGINILNYSSITREADEILALLSQNKGAFPGFEGGIEGGLEGEPTNAPNIPLPPHMSPETPYESRYFSVLFDSEGKVVFAETSKIAAIDSEDAEEYARKILSSDKEKGFIDRFRYIKRAEGSLMRVTFLDWGRQLEAFKSFLITGICMALAGLIAVFFVIFFIAGKILRPISESYEKQKRFITDAGHEIKTPLTVINANVDILEMEQGGSDSLDDIRQQTKRLTKLTGDLVYLARMEEAGNSSPRIEFPVSEVMQEAISPFKTVAQAQNKELVCSISPMISMVGNDDSIRQLISILMDNALKYSAAGGRISAELSRQGKSIILAVTNTASSPIDKDKLPHVFDRFYRADPSRNSSTGGHGIGLSIAQAIVHAHGGRIQATACDGNLFTITATFPI